MKWGHIFVPSFHDVDHWNLIRVFVCVCVNAINIHVVFIGKGMSVGCISTNWYSLYCHVLIFSRLTLLYHIHQSLLGITQFTSMFVLLSIITLLLFSGIILYLNPFIIEFVIWYFFWVLRMQFLQRVFSIDTIVKPLPLAMAYNVSHNLNFFMCIFTQFFGEFWFLCAIYG